MLKDFLWKKCESLGRNNDPVFAVLGIAVFKGIFRPLFTMMDKQEDPAKKKYAAFREGLTEAIAFCSYLGTSFLAKSIAKPLCKKLNKPELLHKTEKSLSFIAVCFSAALLIPGVCNVTLKPIMDSVQKLQKTKKLVKKEEENHLDIKENAVSEKSSLTQVAPVLSETSRSLLSAVNRQAVLPNSSMKVGG